MGHISAQEGAGFAEYLAEAIRISDEKLSDPDVPQLCTRRIKNLERYIAGSVIYAVVNSSYKVSLSGILNLFGVDREDYFSALDRAREDGVISSQGSLDVLRGGYCG